MDLVRFGKRWEINSREDYDNAMKALADADFCAQMCDDYDRERRERAEVSRQRIEIAHMAKEKGII